MAGFAGVVPFFIDNYYVILISRIVFGVGVGFFNSLAITVIDLLYSGSAKTKLLGIRTSMEQLGYSLASLMMGFAVTWMAFWLLNLCLGNSNIIYFLEVCT